MSGPSKLRRRHERDGVPSVEYGASQSVAPRCSPTPRERAKQTRTQRDALAPRRGSTRRHGGRPRHRRGRNPRQSRGFPELDWSVTHLGTLFHDDSAPGQPRSHPPAPPEGAPVLAVQQRQQWTRAHEYVASLQTCECACGCNSKRDAGAVLTSCYWCQRGKHWLVEGKRPDWTPPQASATTTIADPAVTPTPTPLNATGTQWEGNNAAVETHNNTTTNNEDQRERRESGGEEQGSGWSS